MSKAPKQQSVQDLVDIEINRQNELKEKIAFDNRQQVKTPQTTQAVIETIVVTKEVETPVEAVTMTAPVVEPAADPVVETPVIEENKVEEVK